MPFDPVILLLGIYLKEPKTLIQKNISNPMIIAVLFTITKNCKQTKCPSVNEWIKNYGTFTPKKKSFTLCNSMDGPGEHYAK